MEICQIFRACGALKNHCFLAFLHCKTPIFFACGELKMMIFLLENALCSVFFSPAASYTGDLCITFLKIFTCGGLNCISYFLQAFANLLWYFASILQICFGILQTHFDILQAVYKRVLIFLQDFANLLWYFASCLQTCFDILQTHFDILQAVYKLVLVFLQDFANLLWYFASRLQTSSVFCKQPARPGENFQKCNALCDRKSPF